MRKLILLAAALAAIAVFAIPAFGATKTVKVGDNFFKPKTLTVNSGTIVKWSWTGRAPHNVTVTKGREKFRSGTKTSGTYRHKMRRGGTYKIVCTIHPGMEMTLKVR